MDLKLVLDESIDNVVELQDCSPESSRNEEIEYHKESQRETLQLLGETRHQCNLITFHVKKSSKGLGFFFCNLITDFFSFS